jgi:hypothetical protein
LGAISSVWIGALCASWLAISIAKHLSLKRVVARVKELDPVRWLNMGCPEPTLFRRFSDYVQTSPVASRAMVTPTEFTDLSQWLDSRHYEQVNDPTLSAAAARYKLLSNVQFAASVIVLGTILASRVFHRYVAP